MTFGKTKEVSEGFAKDRLSIFAVLHPQKVFRSFLKISEFQTLKSFLFKNAVRVRWLNMFIRLPNQHTIHPQREPRLRKFFEFFKSKPANLSNNFLKRSEKLIRRDGFISFLEQNERLSFSLLARKLINQSSRQTFSLHSTSLVDQFLRLSLSLCSRKLVDQSHLLSLSLRSR